MASGDELLTSTQAGLILGKSGRTVVRLATESKRLPYAHQLPGPNGALLFRRADVEALAQELADDHNNGDHERAAV